MSRRLTAALRADLKSRVYPPDRRGATAGIFLQKDVVHRVQVAWPELYQLDSSEMRHKIEPKV